MKTARYIFLFALILITSQSFTQKYIAYLPEDREFIGDEDLVDVTMFNSVFCEILNIKENQEVLVSETAMAWNSANQIYYYRFTDLLNEKNSFEANIIHVDPYNNPLKSVEIVDLKTEKIIEEWEYQYGESMVEKITVKRYISGSEKPEVFEVIYDGNEDDFMQETIYTPKKTILQQTKNYYNFEENEGYQKVTKRYMNDPLTLVQTDSVIHGKDYFKEAHYQTINNKTTKTTNTYGTKEILTDEGENYLILIESIKIDGRDAIRYEYEYDENGNWIVRKTFEMKNDKWEYSSVTKRTIAYRM